MVVSFFALAEAARAVTPASVKVHDLTPAGVEPHDLELTTDQVDRIEDAEVVVLIPGFQPAVDRAAKRAKGKVVEIDAGDDPHVWLDPLRMRDIANRIGQAVPGSIPEHWDPHLEALDNAFTNGLRDCDRRTLVTAHDAFGAWARYGLDLHAVTGRSPEAEPDPRRLAELADLIRRTGTITVFAEELVPKSAAEAVAREAGVNVGTLDPLESGTPRTYDEVMRENLAKLRIALGCR